MDQENGAVLAAVEQLLSAYDPASGDPSTFFAAQFDAGLAFVDFPVGRGGLGVSPAQQRVVEERLRSAGAKSALLRNPIGVGMAAPTIMRHGTVEQQQRFLKPLFTGTQMWCQLFSEPAAGSDLAGVSTRAVRDGEHWVVTGQKVWTSLAHVAQRGLLLARTNPDVPKHAGLTYLLVDMSAPGVEVRPLRQMTGEAEFNEVFLTEVAVPDADRLGDVGDGWRVAMTTLMSERVALSGAGSGGSANVGGAGIDRVIEAATTAGISRDAVVRDRLMQAYIDGQVIRMTNLRARDNRRAGRALGPEGSITKLLQALYNQRLQELAVTIAGPAAMAWGGDGSVPAARIVHGFERAQANTIEGGTSAVQRNVLGERVLGLPPEPRTDRDVPWTSLPR